MKINGTVYKCKAILFFKGYRQKQGLKLFDTYSSVTRITFIWMLIVLSMVYDIQIHQVDVKRTLWNGELEEEIYIEKPEGFPVPDK